MVERHYHCPLCNSKFETAKALMIHLEDKHPEERIDKRQIVAHEAAD